MKLLSLNIEGKYKSLTNFNYEFKSMDYKYNPMEPICFVGLNGSGKSNIIEVLSEIFCFVELYCLDYGPKWAKESPLSFELCYTKKNRNKENKVCLISKKGKVPLLNVDGEDIDPTNRAEIFKWLPDRIVGYTSGDNETISFPFMRNQGFYAGELTSIKDTKTDTLVTHTKSLFMDYDINSLILISNYLFKSSRKLSEFKDFLRIKNVSSFRIKIALEKKGRKKVDTTSELDTIIDKLIKCSLINDYNAKEKTWTLDFVVNDATRKAFKCVFGDVETLFTSLYKLNLLNSLRLTGAERTFYTNKPKKNALIEKPPVVPKEDRAFLVDQLKLHIEKPNKEIDYVGISDGEHQFIHIIGTIMLFEESNTLYLFDEPESHFNPNWRTKFIDILDRCIESKYPELLISTHSPYVVSGCKSHNVVKLMREGEAIIPAEPKINTFGSTFESLLKELFEVKSSISKYSSEELNKVLQENDINSLKKALGDYGESPEKRRLYEAIIRLEEG